MHTIALLLAAYICYLLNQLATTLERKKEKRFEDRQYEFPLSLHIFFSPPLTHSSRDICMHIYIYIFFFFYDLFTA